MEWPDEDVEFVSKLVLFADGGQSEHKALFDYGPLIFPRLVSVVCKGDAGLRAAGLDALCRLVKVKSVGRMIVNALCGFAGLSHADLKVRSECAMGIGRVLQRCFALSDREREDIGWIRVLPHLIRLCEHPMTAEAAFQALVQLRGLLGTRTFYRRFYRALLAHQQAQIDLEGAADQDDDDGQNRIVNEEKGLDRDESDPSSYDDDDNKNRRMAQKRPRRKVSYMLWRLLQGEDGYLETSVDGLKALTLAIEPHDHTRREIVGFLVPMLDSFDMEISEAALQAIIVHFDYELCFDLVANHPLADTIARKSHTMRPSSSRTGRNSKQNHQRQKHDESSLFDADSTDTVSGLPPRRHNSARLASPSCSINTTLSNGNIRSANGNFVSSPAHSVKSAGSPYNGRSNSSGSSPLSGSSQSPKSSVFLSAGNSMVRMNAQLTTLKRKTSGRRRVSSGSSNSTSSSNNNNNNNFDDVATYVDSSSTSTPKSSTTNSAGIRRNSKNQLVIAAAQGAMNHKKNLTSTSTTRDSSVSPHSLPPTSPSHANQRSVKPLSASQPLTTRKFKFDMDYADDDDDDDDNDNETEEETLSRTATTNVGPSSRYRQTSAPPSSSSASPLSGDDDLGHHGLSVQSTKIGARRRTQSSTAAPFSQTSRSFSGRSTYSGMDICEDENGTDLEVSPQISSSNLTSRSFSSRHQRKEDVDNNEATPHRRPISRRHSFSSPRTGTPSTTSSNLSHEEETPRSGSFSTPRSNIGGEPGSKDFLSTTAELPNTVEGLINMLNDESEWQGQLAVLNAIKSNQNQQLPKDFNENPVVIQGVIKLTSSLRSVLCKNSLLCLHFLINNNGERFWQSQNSTLVDSIVTALVKKSIDSSSFLAQEAKTAMNACVECFPPNKLCTSILQHCNQNPNPNARASSAQILLGLVEKHPVSSYDSNRVVQCAKEKLLHDNTVQARAAAKGILTCLNETRNLDKKQQLHFQRIKLNPSAQRHDSSSRKARTKIPSSSSSDGPPPSAGSSGTLDMYQNLIQGLRSKDWQTRVDSLQSLEHALQKNTNPALLEHCAEKADDPNLRVRIQAIQTTHSVARQYAKKVSAEKLSTILVPIARACGDRQTQKIALACMEDYARDSDISAPLQRHLQTLPPRAKGVLNPLFAQHF